jgi:RNA polymerase sigma-70 factor (ECF subfamily)
MTGQGTAVAPGAVAQPLFATTHWSIVLAAANHETPGAAVGLEQLCRTYWYPLYAYVRRSGHNPEDSQDFTQEFFHRLLHKDYLAQVKRQKGKFRSFLLACLRHFLSEQRDRARTVKRGGGANCLSLDAQTAEERYRLEPVDRMDAEKIFERRWAMTLLEHALRRLRDETASAGNAEMFDRLKDFVAGESEVTCSEVADRMKMTESAVKSALHRLRQRYRELVREEVAHTVADPAEIDVELRYLIMVVSQ